MNLKIELARVEDAPQIRNMLEQLYSELGEESESIAFLSEGLVQDLIGSGRTTILLAALPPNETVGLLTMSETQAIYAGGAYGVIDEMFVLPGFRSKNIGSRLVEEAKSVGRKRGWKRIDVTAPTDANDRTVEFYRRLGFAHTGPKMKWAVEPCSD